MPIAGRALSRTLRCSSSRVQKEQRLLRSKWKYTPGRPLSAATVSEKDDIGVEEDSEVERFLLWLHSRQMGTTAAVGHANDQVKRALDVLDSHGFSVSADMKSDMEAALALGEACSE